MELALETQALRKHVILTTHIATCNRPRGKFLNKQNIVTHHGAIVCNLFQINTRGWAALGKATPAFHTIGQDHSSSGLSQRLTNALLDYRLQQMKEDISKGL